MTAPMVGPLLKALQSLLNCFIMDRARSLEALYEALAFVLLNLPLYSEFESLEVTKFTNQVLYLLGCISDKRHEVVRQSYLELSHNVLNDEKDD